MGLSDKFELDDLVEFTKALTTISEKIYKSADVKEIKEENSTYTSKEKCINALKELIMDGFEVIPADDLERALKGFVAFKTVDEYEVCKNLTYPIFDKEFEPDVVLLDDSSEFVRFVETHDVLPCDNPQKLQVGFVFYDKDNCKSVVRRIGVSKTKDIDKQLFDKSKYALNTSLEEINKLKELVEKERKASEDSV